MEITKKCICPLDKKLIDPKDCRNKVKSKPVVGARDIFHYCREYCNANWAKGEISDKIVIKKNSPVAALGAVEKNIPIPAVSRKGQGGTNSCYPFKDMVVGDSFAVQSKTKDRVDRRKVTETLLCAAAHFKKKYHPDWLFTIRQTEDGARIWRTK